MKKLMVLFVMVLLISCSKEQKVHSAVKEYVKNELQDPASYESVWYSDVNVLNDSLGNNIGWIVVHIYRTKNIYGGYEELSETYTLDTKFNVDQSLLGKL